MAAGDTHAADLIDIVRHEMASVVCSHHFYKIGEQLILEKKPVGQSTQ